MKSTPKISAADYRPVAASAKNGAARKAFRIDASRDHYGQQCGRLADFGALNYSSTPSATSEFAKLAAPTILAVE